MKKASSVTDLTVIFRAKKGKNRVFLFKVVQKMAQILIFWTQEMALFDWVVLVLSWCWGLGFDNIGAALSWSWGWVLMIWVRLITFPLV